MGFLSSLVKTVVGIGRAVIGLPPAAAAATARTTLPVIGAGAASTVLAGAGGLTLPAKIGGALRAVIASPTVRAVGAIGAGTALGAVAAQALTGGGAAAGDGTVLMGGGVGRGNGQFVKQTVVQTLLVATGEVVRQEVFAGAPFMMNKDVSRAKMIEKRVRGLARKFGTKTRKESKSKQLTDAVTDRALQNVIAGTAARCP